jgi:uncharacterized membrane protein
MKRWSQRACIAIALFAGLRLLFAWQALPDKVASHFGADGRADAFQSRDSFMILSLGMLLAMLAIFVALPSLLRRLPPRMLNVPNREYWLTDERKDEALLRLSHHLGVIGVLTLGFMAAVFELVLRANFAGRPLDNAWMYSLLALLYGGMITRLIMIYRDFRVPEDAH